MPHFCEMPNCDARSTVTASIRLFDDVGEAREIRINICEKDLCLLTRAGIVDSVQPSTPSETTRELITLFTLALG